MRDRTPSSKRTPSAKPLPQLPRGRHALTREQVVESQRSRIVQAITEVVSAQGYHGASLTEITGRAGISRKTFYEHFEDKQACFIAAFQPRFATIVDVALESYAGADPWPDRVRRALSTLLDAIHADPSGARLCFVETLTAGPQAMAARIRELERLEAIYLPDDADASPMARTTARILVGGLADVIHRNVVAEADVRTLLPHLLFSALSSQLGPSAAATLIERADPD